MIPGMICDPKVIGIFMLVPNKQVAVFFGFFCFKHLSLILFPHFAKFDVTLIQVFFKKHLDLMSYSIIFPDFVNIFINITWENAISFLAFFQAILKTLTLQKNLCYLLQLKRSLKMMKNSFYFPLKAFFLLKIFKFLSWLFGHVEKTARLER